MEAILDESMANVLYCYRNWLKREAQDAYDRELTVWSNIAPHSTKKVKPPEKPDILKRD